MKDAPKRNKGLKVLGFLLLFLLLLGGAGYYLLVHKFREIVQVIVEKESKGRYTFDASRIDVSLFSRRVELNDISITCMDTMQVATRYNINIPRVYLSLESLGDLLFHKKISIDSMAVVSPQLSAYGGYPVDTARRTSFPPSQIMDILQKIVQHMQIRSFKLADASFSWHNPATNIPFSGSHINFSITNFSEKDPVKSYLFSSDDIDLLITDQYWKLPDGLHEIGFKKLHFSGRSQHFEIDSCVFRAKGDARQSAVSLRADKLLFNSKQLQDAYEKEELVIDTLLCYKPVLNLQTTGPPGRDTSAALTDAMHRLFKKMNFRYIDIRDGRFALNDSNNIHPAYITRQTNLTLFSLAINPGSRPGMTVDSMRLNLGQVKFITKDSLYQLTVGELALNKDMLVLRDTRFGPTPFNHRPGNMRFATSALYLRDISLEDLMQKRLSGAIAEIYHPVIILSGAGKARNTSSAAISTVSFYKTLHGLGELIQVDSFHIVDGDIRFESPAEGIGAELKSINGVVLMSRFLQSDSLIDIKRSLPDLDIKTIAVHTPAVKLLVSDFHFNGTFRHSTAGLLRLSLANESEVTAKHLYWEIFDWDVFQKTREIQVENISVQEITADIKGPGNACKAGPPGPLPVIRVSKLDIAKLQMAMQTRSGGRLKMSAQAICLDNLSSKNRFFTWNDVVARVNDFSYSSRQATVRVQKASIDNQYMHVLQEVAFGVNSEKGHATFTAPVITLTAPLHSTDFSRPWLRSFVADKPVIDLYTKGEQGEAREKQLLQPPIDCDIDRLMINDATVHYRNEKDSSDLKSRLTLGVHGLQTYTNGAQLLRYGTVSLATTDLTLRQSKYFLHLPGSSIELAGGEIRPSGKGNRMFRSGVVFNWNGLSLTMHRPDSSFLTASGFSGTYNNPRFEFGKGDKIQWTALAGNTIIRSGDISLGNKTIDAGITGLQWNGATRTFHGGAFHMTPKLGMEASFSRAKWQYDYMVIKGNGLDIYGIRFNRRDGDSLLEVQKIVLDRLALTAARDKRLPFKHGTEKYMPTGLPGAVKFPFRIDSLLLRQSSVAVHEVSAITNREGIIPLEDLDAVITNIKNRPGEKDTLAISARTRLLNNYIDNLRYKESYTDTLSFFTLHFHASPMVLPAFSAATTPLAAIRVNSGNADTLYADWTGNKYAAIGKMNFYYRGLSVQLLDRNEPARKRFGLSVMNFLANNLVLHKKNTKESLVFFERDREKFVFNYWVKTSLSGLLSSTGIKGNRKYYKKYRKVLTTYSLPPVQL